MKLIAIAVVLRDGKVLIGKRPPGAPLAGLWEFPGGKVEPAEAPAAAAVRECLEEAGLSIEVVGEYPAVLHVYDHGGVELRFFDCRMVDGSERPRDPYRFVPAASIADYEFPAANRDLVQRLARGEFRSHEPQ